jgi:NADH:ubiquinone oxidoreductase subunit F (NADH-binding)/NADH:ubiquinone oxidoreductase subunit E
MMGAHSIVEAALVGHQIESADVRGSLLPILRAVQHRLGHLPAEIFEEIEAQLGIPRHIGYSVASFYDEFRFDRPAAHAIRVCDGAACELAGCGELLMALSAELGIGPREVTADGCFRLEAANCLGQCERCPAVRIDDWVFGPLAASELPGLLRLVRSGGAAASAELARRAAQNDGFPAARPGEQRRLLECPMPAASVAAAWEAAGRGKSLHDLLGRYSPAELLRVVSDSGLRGRGGAGFPTAKKWQMAAGYPPPRVLVCNADESEPGTFKDRLLLRHRPWLVLEGMLLSAYAIGADRGVLYLRSDYAYLQPQLDDCLSAMAAAGLLGEKIAGSAFACRIDVHLGAGAYICGEESALLQSLEGQRGEPRLRPPFPVEFGWKGRPTVVSNVETLAYVPHIAAHGAAWFREVGTAESAGTKLFSLSGDVERPGVYELPLGATLGELIRGPGGGVRGELGFVLLGGAAGRALGKDCLNTPMDFEHQVGNGAVTVFQTGRRPIEVGANLLRFFSRETCGGCLPCRAGVPEAFAMFASAGPQGLTARQRASFDLLSDCLETTARCGLGKTALKAARDLLELS